MMKKIKEYLMKVWITKYALTRGIIEADGELTSSDSVSILNRDLSLPTHWFYKGDWHSDKESAIAKAEEMRQKKIESLKKQIEKLEEMKFE